ncbi:MAG: hypothetical protein IPL46_31690 [Saprospiraceae bacterium]|nr:hypothetical protein [Saprospiraceae bacterium]
MKYKIRGKVIFNDLSGGFWGIEGNDGRQWRPVNMPEQLKVRGALIEVTGEDDDSESIFMWGDPIRIVAFHTLPKL